jgi:threonine aldolase
MEIRIDLGSDTATRPSQAMLAFMISCPVGDDQKGEDPTVNQLQKQVATLLGMESALFLPSATMANEIALKVHTRPGDEVIVEAGAHFVTAEGGGPAFLSGVMTCRLEGRRGIFGADQVERAIRPDGPHYPPTSLVCVEQTTNLGGGAVWPQNRLREVVAVARQHGLAAHMDGARLMNAVVASGIPAHVHTQGFDSVTLCLSKGLACPIGALLTGSEGFIQEARRYKHLLGGAMRQAGVIAGAGLFALDNNIERLAEDHENAWLLATLLSGIPGIAIDPSAIETNIVFFDVAGTGLSGQELVDALRQRGTRVGARWRDTVIRAVTHRDVGPADIETAARQIREIVAERAR